MGFKILVRSAPSLFLESLINIFEDQPYILLTPSSSELKWDDAKAVESYIKKKSPSVIVNNPLIPLQANAAELKSLQKIISQCKAKNIRFIHISSYKVFGELSNEVDLLEDLKPNPAASDIQAQHLKNMEEICQELECYNILRLGWMLNGEVDNIVDRLVPMLLFGGAQELLVSDHAFGNPVQVQFAVHVVFSMIQQILCGAENWGAFHVHSSDTCSEAEFCDNLVRLLNAELSREISLPFVASADDDRKLMPGNAHIQGRRCTDNFGIQLPSWRKGLKALVRLYIERARLMEEIEDV